ncbi:MAG: precorrin-6Y C5,15-methyltransferase (decarboxylating) subunit CbiT [Schwartzia succinivorans]|jgi:precorrin-6Y C5,15-methyltransferase (decarboxylating) CbiT subunit|uniref:precorrin-6Y C5,15-methyltransferase (decarboxylating) subunit CbiT n=1 Tax=Schwartzia succinivorans TaxID=55507 RepID=UPI002353FA00|nr:precorrin-6Y C5,15-methyltransferase (decarboxylating) subunit CbiT [Schwartzia succinivorans]MBE6098163.1 precorrin-6Y C5,15-methyltransferase (decarboxylating) subunit CbiT [Schwartzia succinivorans]
MAFLGIPDEEFIRGKVPMTKQEIRVLTMVKAQISKNDIVWDIGAGTGSLSIEAARLAENGHVYSIERNPEGIGLIKKNAEKFGVSNLTVIEAEAPAGMENMPDCDAVIIGGSGKQLDPILDVINAHLKVGGHIVLNCITIQTLSSCLAYMRSHKEEFKYEAIQVQVNRLEAVGPYDMAKAINPIYIVTCKKIK